MINTLSTDFKRVKEIAEEVKREVNRLYKKLEIDLDGIYKTMLLLKKKKYAALTISKVDGKIVTSREVKVKLVVRLSHF